MIFTSDNGPWLSYGDHAGSAGPLREGKGTSWEGGIRVPCIMRWPGKIPAGTTSDAMLMTIDLLPTHRQARRRQAPRARDRRPRRLAAAGRRARREESARGLLLLLRAQPAPGRRQRRRPLEARLPHTYRTLDGRPGGKGAAPVQYDKNTVARPELYDLKGDVSRGRDVASVHPEGNVVAALLAEAEKAATTWATASPSEPAATSGRRAGRPGGRLNLGWV